MNNIAYFEIQATNPNQLVKFYQAIFDWKFELDGSLPIEYYRIQGAGPFGGLLQRPVATPPTHMGTNAYTCSVEVEDFDKTAKLVLDNGGQIAMEKFAVPGKCWQGYFLDPDNNVFGLFQVDPTAT